MLQASGGGEEANNDTYPRLAESSWLMEFLAAECSTLVEPNGKLVARQAGAVDVHAGWIVYVARRVDDSLESSIENNDSTNEIIRALGRDVCSGRVGLF